MNIALIAHDAKKELMVQFCIAYCGVLSRHNLCATGTTGKMVAEATGLNIVRYMSGTQGGDQQISARIACDEIDLLLFFRDPMTVKSACAICAISRWQPTSPPPRCSSTAWSAATSTGATSSIRITEYPADHSAALGFRDRQRGAHGAPLFVYGRRTAPSVPRGVFEPWP